MFEDATFDSRSVQRSQAPRWMLLTLTVNLGVVAAMIVLPLMYPASLPTQLLQRALYVPTPPMAAAQRPEAHQAAPSSASPVRNLYQIPTTIPTLIPRDPIGAAPATTLLDLGSGMPGGDNVPGADGRRIFQTSSAPVVQRAQPASMTVSGGVLEGMLISKTTPAYPTIARTAGISGTVVLAATISREGTIVNLRVVSGNLMLTQAAMDAVKTWRYRPYLLNGQPVEVETTINVVFSMGNR
jgi:protein TonB